MKNFNDNFEKILTVIAGSIGIMAIFIKLQLNGYTLENTIDAVKELAGLIVVVAVFLVANKIFRKDGKIDFTKIFEKHLKDWIDQNDYLVCENFDEEGKGKFNKRYCSMVIDHSNFITRMKLAKDTTDKKERGAFVYLPYIGEDGIKRDEFEFRFNERTFERQNIYKKDNGEADLYAITQQFAKSINDTFKYLGIHAKANPSNKTITVAFVKMKQTEENARKLIELVEFVKTMVLALA